MSEPVQTASSIPEILVEDLTSSGKEPGIVRVSLNRPEKRNAITDEMRAELRRVFDELGTRNDVKVVILRGVGSCFSAGNDMGTVPQLTDIDIVELTHVYRETYDWIPTVWKCEKPVIAEVQSHCLGSATELAALCDITICSSDAEFGWPELFGGGVPATIWTLLIGYKRASELLLTGQVISADEAKEIGLVNHIVPKDDLELRTLQLARRLAVMPLPALVFGKLSIHATFERLGLSDDMATSKYLSLMSKASGHAPEYWEIAREKGARAASEWRRDVIAATGWDEARVADAD